MVGDGRKIGLSGGSFQTILLMLWSDFWELGLDSVPGTGVWVNYAV